MKKIITLIAIGVCFGGCGYTDEIDNKIEHDIEVIAETKDWKLSKIKVDTNEYLILTCYQNAVAIIKHN